MQWEGSNSSGSRGDLNAVEGGEREVGGGWEGAERSTGRGEEHEGGGLESGGGWMQCMGYWGERKEGGGREGPWNMQLEGPGQQQGEGVNQQGAKCSGRGRARVGRGA